LTSPVSPLSYDGTGLKQLKTICFAIPFMATLFCIIALINSFGNFKILSTFFGFPDTASAPAGLQTLRIIHLVITIIVVFASRLIGEKVLASKNQLSGQEPTPIFARYRTSVIVQLALIEGAVLFGAIVVMVTPPPVIQNDPTYYLHLTPLVLLILRAMQLSPTADKLEMISRAYQN
jgi:hypothetical protein